MNTDDKDSHNKDIITTPNTKSSSTDVTGKDSIPTITPSSLAAFSDEEAARTLLILTGATIAAIPKQAAFFADTARFKGAICCRVTPKQKVSPRRNSHLERHHALPEKHHETDRFGGRRRRQRRFDDPKRLHRRGTPRKGGKTGGTCRRLRHRRVPAAETPAVCARRTELQSQLDDHLLFALQKRRSLQLPVRVGVSREIHRRYSFYSLFSGSSQFNSYYLTYYSIAIFVAFFALSHTAPHRGAGSQARVPRRAAAQQPRHLPLL